MSYRTDVTPSNTDSRDVLQTGRELVASGKHGEAIEHYQSALLSLRRDVDRDLCRKLYNNIALCHLALGCPLDALASCEQALALGEAAKVLYTHGRVLMCLGGSAHAAHAVRSLTMAHLLSPREDIASLLEEAMLNAGETRVPTVPSEQRWVEFTSMTLEEMRSLVLDHIEMMRSKYGWRMAVSSFPVMCRAVEKRLSRGDIVFIESQQVFVSALLADVPLTVQIQQFSGVHVNVPYGVSVRTDLPVRSCRIPFSRDVELHLLPLHVVLSFQVFPRYQQVKGRHVRWTGQPFFFVSHKWHSQFHPDPEGKTKKMLTSRRRGRLSIRHIGSPKRMLPDSEPSLGFVGTEVRLLAPNSLVWIDYCCLPQPPRIMREQELFNELLMQMGCFYRTNMLVLRCYEPQDSLRRGWIAFETLLSVLCGYDRPENSALREPDAVSSLFDVSWPHSDVAERERLAAHISDKLLQDCEFTQRDDVRAVRDMVQQVAVQFGESAADMFSNASEDESSIGLSSEWHGLACSHCSGEVLTVDNADKVIVRYPVDFDKVVAKQASIIGGSMTPLNSSRRVPPSIVKNLLNQGGATVDPALRLVFNPLALPIPWTVQVDLHSMELLSLAVPPGAHVSTNLSVLELSSSDVSADAIALAREPFTSHQGLDVTEVSLVPQEWRADLGRFDHPAFLDSEDGQRQWCLMHKQQGDRAAHNGHDTVALEHYAKARRTAIDIGDRKMAMLVSGNRALARSRIGEHAAAVNELLAALAFDELLGQSPENEPFRVMYWRLIGRNEASQQRWHSARWACQQAQEACHDHGQAYDIDAELVLYQAHCDAQTS